VVCSKTYPVQVRSALRLVFLVFSHRCFFLQASALKKGGFAVMNGRPVKIISMSTSKTGKHGSAKIHFVATDIFTGKKIEDICPSTSNMEAPNVKRTELPLLDIDEDGFCSLMEVRLFFVFFCSFDSVRASVFGSKLF
jgi:translation elongation factor IF5A